MICAFLYKKSKKWPWSQLKWQLENGRSIMTWRLLHVFSYGMVSFKYTVIACLILYEHNDFWIQIMNTKSSRSCANLKITSETLLVEYKTIDCASAELGLKTNHRDKLRSTPNLHLIYTYVWIRWHQTIIHEQQVCIYFIEKSRCYWPMRLLILLIIFIFVNAAVGCESRNSEDKIRPRVSWCF